MVRSQQPFLEPGTAFAAYQVQAVIGRGGMGVVYQARDVRLDRRVALKLLAPEFTTHENFRARFLRESRLAAAVDHPNIIPIYEAGDADGQLFIAMRYVPGVDLRRELEQRSRLERAEALALLQQLADALDAAHEAGLVHRDVKPANVLLADRSAQGRRHAYLTDFGLTRRSASISGLTTTGHFLGTLDYVAPEQIRGETVDGRADVYSFACLAYATLVGRPPFDQEDDVALMWAHLSLVPPRAAEFRPELAGSIDDALAAGLAKSAAERPESCGALVALMDGGGAHRPAATAPAPAQLVVPVPTTRLSVPPPGTSTPAGAPAADGWSRPDEPLPGLGPGPAGAPAGRRRRRRLPWALAAVALTLAAVAALGGWLLLRDGEEPWTTFAADGVPYTLDVPADWDVHRHEAGGSTVTVLSPTDLRGLFGDEPEALATAAAAVRSDPQDVVGVAVYHRPRLEGDAADALLQASQALLPGQGGRLRPGERVRVGDLEATAMPGDLVLADDVPLQLRVLVLDSTPRQMLVFFAPPAVAAELSGTFDRVAASLTSSG